MISFCCHWNSNLETQACFEHQLQTELPLPLINSSCSNWRGKWNPRYKFCPQLLKCNIRGEIRPCLLKKLKSVLHLSTNIDVHHMTTYVRLMTSEYNQQSVDTGYKHSMCLAGHSQKPTEQKSQTHFISYQTSKPTLIHHWPHHSRMAKSQVIYAGSFKRLLIRPIAPLSHIWYMLHILLILFSYPSGFENCLPQRHKVSDPDLWKIKGRGKKTTVALVCF